MFKSVFFSVLLSATFIGNTQNNTPVFVSDSLETYVSSEQKLWQIPAVAVGIVKDGKIVKTFVNGVKDIVSQEPIDENTLFMIGSNSKSFTSILMATLAEENAFSLNDAVKKWLPYFKLSDPWLTKKVNIIDVLSHRVGFETFQGDFLNFDNELTSEEIIKKFALIKPKHEYRDTWGYFNTGYTISGEIIKASTGKTWAEQIHERLFIPLDMTNSLALSSDIKKANNRTLAHTIVDEKVISIPYGDIDATAPAGSISSSVADLSKWVMTLLNNGKYKDNQIIPEKAIAATIIPRTILGNGSHFFNKNQFSLYGLGWFLQDYEGYKMVSHVGGIHGYVTSVTTIPELNLGVIVLTNTDQNYFYEALKWDIIDAYLNLPQRNYSKVYRQYYKSSTKRKKAKKEERLQQVAKDTKPTLPLNKFVGRYNNQVYGYLNISKKDSSTLIVDFEHHIDLKVTLKHMKDNVFLASYNNPMYGESVFPFKVKNGNIEKFTLKLDPVVEQTTYDFYKENQ